MRMSSAPHYCRCRRRGFPVSRSRNAEPIPGIKPDFVTDAERLDECVPENFFDLVISDPPYGLNHIKYGIKKKVNRKRVVHLCSKVLKAGGYLIWLDTVLPQWRKADGWTLCGLIGLGQFTNHQVRVVTILQKMASSNQPEVF